MAVELNHTIVHATDREATAAFLADVLGLDPPTSFGPFLVVQCANGVSLDVIAAGDEPFDRQHYAFLVSEDEFDTIFRRIRERELPYWADPGRQHAGEVNHNWGGRGVYFPDPDDHHLEIITVPYGGW